MAELPERAREYLDALEAERQAALDLSKQKAQEAKLIKARQEGFQAAIELLAGEMPERYIGPAEDSEEPGDRRTRRRIPDLIIRELSFSGQALTARQIAKAIDYTLPGTETALERLEKAGQVLRTEGNRWAIALADSTSMNGHHVKSGNGKSLGSMDA